MSKLIDSIKKYWYWYLVGILFLMQSGVFLIFNDECYLQIHDNLDLFMAHYEMLKVNGLWFAHDVNAPMLHGVTRDLFGSEFNLYNMLYIIFPGVWAYIIGYALKIAIGMFSFVLLAKDIIINNKEVSDDAKAMEKYNFYKPLIIVIGAAFGLIPVFPTYGIAFTSVPLIVYFLRRLYVLDAQKAKLNKKLPFYAAVFLYPLLSYFSYHGFFILCYMVCAVIILWIKDKKIPKTTLVSVLVLSVGYMLFEYRLFGAMLFDDTVTIRTTMNHGNLTFGEALKTAFTEFVTASFHSQDSHTYIVFPVVIAALIIINFMHIKRHEAKKILTDPINLVTLWIIFNVIIFGFYEFEPFRHLIETIVPKLTGFEFARTAYFNTFLWYALLLMVCMRMYDLYKDSHDMNEENAGTEDVSANGIKALRVQKWEKAPVIAANIIVTLAILIVMFAPQVYNDFYYTCYNEAYKVIKHKETSTVNYREFYSKDLFTDIKNDLGYNGEWSVAYGLHPAVLEYNGIATLDGYLGMYPQEYKEKWGRIIAPALEGSPSLKDYFDGWGARVTVYSGNDENTYAPLRVMTLSDNSLTVDMDELTGLDCKYIFSRIKFDNDSETGIKLIKEYEGAGHNSPYTIYVYETP